MKKYLFLCLTILFLSAGCKKKKDINQYLIEEWPQHWILVMDNKDPVFIKILRQSGNVVLRYEVGRADFDRNYFSANIEGCEWEARLVENTDGIVSIHSNTFKDQRWGVIKETHPTTNQTQYALIVTNDPVNNYGQNEGLFKLHNRSFSNGIKKVSFESVQYPGYYLADLPTVSFGNGVQLVKLNNPDDAYVFERH